MEGGRFYNGVVIDGVNGGGGAGFVVDDEVHVVVGQGGDGDDCAVGTAAVGIVVGVAHGAGLQLIDGLWFMIIYEYSDGVLYRTVVVVVLFLFSRDLTVDIPRTQLWAFPHRTWIQTGYAIKLWGNAHSPDSKYEPAQKIQDLKIVFHF